MRRGRLAPVAATLIAALLPAAAAQNADTPVEVRSCAAADAVVSAARVELAATPRAIAKVAIVCLPEARVLVVAFPSGTDALAREIDVADAPPEARARAIAIATGELLRSEPTRAAASPAPPPEPPATSAPSPAPPPIVVQIAPPRIVPPAAPAPRPVGWTFGVALRGRFHAATRATSLLGPAADLDVPLGRSGVRLQLGTSLAYGRQRDAAGDVALLAWTGDVGLSVHAEAAPLFLDFGPFVEAGGGFADGTAGDVGRDATGSAPLLFAGGRARLGARLGDALVPYLGVDAGATAAGLDATIDERPVVSAAGPFIGLRLGVAVAP